MKALRIKHTKYSDDVLDQEVVLGFNERGWEPRIMTPHFKHTKGTPLVVIEKPQKPVKKPKFKWTGPTESIKWFREYKETLKCNRCPEDFTRCLEFHHCNGNKEFNIFDMVKQRMPRETIMREIEKCEVLCLNCHKKEHSP